MSTHRAPRHPRLRTGALSLAASALLAPCAAAVDLSGDLSGHLPAGLYRIVDDIAVPAGHSLVLDPGVIFEFEDSWWEEYEFDAEGTLRAEGTASQPIIFRCAPGVSEFNYLRIASSNSRLFHCRVERVGSVTALAEGGLWIDDASPQIERCVVTDAAWNGIYVTGPGSRPVIRWTEVCGGDADGICAEDDAALELRHCIVRDNAGDGVSVGPGGALVVNCLSAANGEAGVDGDGCDDASIDLVHCTVAATGGQNLSDGGTCRLYNTIVTGGAGEVALNRHSYVIDDPAFLRFVDPGGGDWRLGPGSPCRESGTPFLPAGWLPAEDLDGRPRKNGLLDVGAYESPDPPDPGTSGRWFSSALISPRLTQPEIRTPGESLTALVAALGSFTPAGVDARLIAPDGSVVDLEVTQVNACDAAPGSDWETRYYLPGVERIQEITLVVPPGSAPGLCDLELTSGGLTYHSTHAVQVIPAYPAEWSLLHVTDTHIGYDSEEYTAAERMRAFVREANSLNPALVVITGDICENQNLENEARVDSFLAAAADFRLPVYVIPGNHDHYNEGGAYNPYGYFRYFQRINRAQTAEIRFGDARLYAFNTGHELGTLEFYRCFGPTDAALDWVAAKLLELDPGVNRPLFFLMHGPTYDYFSWNANHAERVQSLMDAHGVSLCLAGHTHRFETFRNEGENWLGRNDYSHEDDWGRDLPFPGYPLHVQTSSLGKEEHLPLPATVPASAGLDTAIAAGAAPPGFVVPTEIAEPHRRGLFGDDIGFRVIRVENGEVAFFTCDTDGDGYRNTEDAWLLGELTLSQETLPGSVIVSRIANQHHECWPDIRHYIATDPSVSYTVSGGSLVRRWADGVMEVAVPSLAAGGESVVTLVPGPSSVSPPAGAGREANLQVLVNPFRDQTTIRLEVPDGAITSFGEPVLRIVDCAGRVARRIEALGLAADASSWRVEWDGRDDRARVVPAGVYFARLDAGRWRGSVRMVKIRG